MTSAGSGHSSASAPGKVVLWGEYAVLAGAPAAVLAVNRRAEVLYAAAHNTWRFSSLGFHTPSVQWPGAAFCRAPAAQVAEAVLNGWGFTEYPAAFSLRSDSRAFYHQPAARQNAEKLGIGSSAAVCVATYHLLARQLQRTPDLDEAISIHRALQGGKGSGLDVAASWHGSIRFRQTAGGAEVAPLAAAGAVPLADLHWRVVWTGASSSTSQHISSFSRWRQSHPSGPLDQLCAASESLCNGLDMDRLAVYCERLQALDKAAALNIFTPAHQQLATIAHAEGLVYKPCGAGGGDVGMAFSNSARALAAFCAQASRQGMHILDLETADHGVRTGS